MQKPFHPSLFLFSPSTSFIFTLYLLSFFSSVFRAFLLSFLSSCFPFCISFFLLSGRVSHWPLLLPPFLFFFCFTCSSQSSLFGVLTFYLWLPFVLYICCCHCISFLPVAMLLFSFLNYSFNFFSF